MDYSNFLKVLEQLAKEYEQSYKDKLDVHKKNASSKLYKSVVGSVRFMDNHYQIILTLEDYWKYIDSGRRPGSKMPPINSILKWTIDKGIKPIDKSISQKSLAFIISKSIAKKGIKPNPIMQTLIDENQEVSYKLLFEALQKDINKEVVKLVDVWI